MISIGNGAFSNCDSLESISLPESLINIGESAFSNCSNLKSIIMPSGIIYIDSGVIL
ncbi:MAG: leucine-rich repeat protein [Clostridiales bacterium]|nr:leucine-rich repeat protein [Clostridiales bacterium]